MSEEGEQEEARERGKNSEGTCRSPHTPSWPERLSKAPHTRRRDEHVIALPRQHHPPSHYIKELLSRRRGRERDPSSTPWPPSRTRSCGRDKARPRPEWKKIEDFPRSLGYMLNICLQQEAMRMHLSAVGRRRMRRNEKEEGDDRGEQKEMRREKKNSK